MPSASQSRLTQVTLDVLTRRPGVSDLSTPDQAPGLWLDFDGGPDYFDEECIYDSCSDTICRELLLDFLDCCTPTSWSVQLELSKLLSKRGFVVRERIEPILLNQGDYISHYKSLFLSYLAIMPKGEARVLQLLDSVPDDSRDGLFLACYRMSTESIFRRVVEKVREWHLEDGWWGHDGTGEAFKVLKVLEKCAALYPWVDCKDVLMICKSRPTN